jgi:hypothetical protein
MPADVNMGDSAGPPPLHPEVLSWTALLARWMDFARASVASRHLEDGQLWNQSVTSIITLQAVTFALRDLRQLSRADHALARDRAALLIREHGRVLKEIWRSEVIPPSLLATIDDAQTALDAAQYAGATQLTWPGPGELVVPALDIVAYEGTLLVMHPGTIVPPGEPVAWWIDGDPAPIRTALDRCEITEPAVPHQVYRQVDDDGRIARDVIALITDDPLPGLPLLVPLFERSERIGTFQFEAETWLRQQRAAMRETIAVERHEILNAPEHD